MPFACRNALYDEHWSSKQERGTLVNYLYFNTCVVVTAFTRWLNYVLVPMDNFGNTIPSNGRAGKYTIATCALKLSFF